MTEVTEEAAPLTEEELASIPVFPLPRVVFFPGATLPLHLFEPRYREMMEACVSEGPMAMVIALLEDGWEDDYDGRPPVHEVCGAGRIIDWRRRRDGRFDLLLHGLARVKIEELPAEGRTYRRARATRLEDRVPHPEAVDALRVPVLATAASVVSLVRERYPDFTLGVDAQTPPGLLADRIADRLVSDHEQRQELLGTLDVKVRLAMVQDVLYELLARLRAEGGGGALH